MMTLMVSLNLLFGGKDLTGFYECGTLSKKCLNFKKMLSVLLKKGSKITTFFTTPISTKSLKALTFRICKFHGINDQTTRCTKCWFNLV